MKQYVKPETESFQTAPNSALCASAQVGVTLDKMKVKSFNTPILVFALLSGLLMLPSCKSGNGDIDQPATNLKKGEVVTITTNPLGSANKTPRRVHIKGEENNEAQLVWSAFDQLRVIVPSDETSFPYSDFNLTDGVDTKTGIFTGTMPADGSEVFLAYPCGIVEGDGWDESTNTFTFRGVSVPNVQDFKVGATSFNAGLMPVVGYGKAEQNKTITAKTAIVGGALRVKLTNKTGEAITFNKIQLDVHDSYVSKVGANTSIWASSYTVDYNIESGEVTPSGTSADNNNIVLNLSEKVTLADDETSGDFYFVMVAPLYFKTKVISGGDAFSFTVYLFNYEGKVTSPSDLTSETPVATTSFKYNIDIQPGEIAEGTLEMTKITD